MKCLIKLTKSILFLSAILVALLSIGIGMLISGSFASLGLFKYITSTNRRIIGTVPPTLSHLERSTAWSYDKLGDLSGSVSLVTGANVGLGKYTAFHLASKGSKVIMACRNMHKCNDAAIWMKSEHPGLDLVPMQLNLGSLQSVDNFTKEVLSTFDHLNHIVFNAGFINVNDFELSEDGIETTFAVNHLGHFKIFKDLRPLIEKTAETSDVHIVSVSSGAQFSAPANVGVYTTLEGINNADNFDGTTWYGQSKLANVLFSNEIASQMQSLRVFSNSCHPGVVATSFGDAIKKNISTYFSPMVSSSILYLLSLLEKHLLWSAEDGALTQTYLAASTEVVENDIRGKYFHPIVHENQPNDLATTELQKKLWKFSEDLLSERGF